ncbi:MAG TPA: hypothetical protein ENH70_06480 [Desulfobacteraceae bacterium]|nr:hypothetical protein [Deltaproteobacteria bacterium]HDZ24168.1 hypothetical protein [Desulfobacteraceae bacterium]
MKLCTSCVLPETFPGIVFDKAGVCNYCRKSLVRKNSSTDLKKKYSDRFLALIAEIREDDRYSQRPYDVIAAYSGGKDSSFTLRVLAIDFQLKVLAMTFNNSFLAPRALENIKNVCTSLKIDHMMVSPSRGILSRAFRNSINADCYPPKALQRASTICNTCMDLIKSLILKTAIEMGIPLISYGWSPGQIPVQSSVMRFNLSMLKQTQGAMKRCVLKIMGEEALPFLLQKRHLDLFSGNTYNISPLAFLEYDERVILNEIGSLGWESPGDTDANSTNCLLNAFANKAHQERFGFHPYAFEIAGLVRGGYMSRETGLKRLSMPVDSGSLKAVSEKLGLSKQ